MALGYKFPSIVTNIQYNLIVFFVGPALIMAHTVLQV